MLVVYILTKYSRLMNMKYIQVLLVLSLVPRYYIVQDYVPKNKCAHTNMYVPAKLSGDCQIKYPREIHGKPQIQI